MEEKTPLMLWAGPAIVGTIAGIAVAAVILVALLLPEIDTHSETTEPETGITEQLETEAEEHNEDGAAAEEGETNSETATEDHNEESAIENEEEGAAGNDEASSEESETTTD